MTYVLNSKFILRSFSSFLFYWVIRSNMFRPCPKIEAYNKSTVKVWLQAGLDLRDSHSYF